MRTFSDHGRACHGGPRRRLAPPPRGTIKIGVIQPLTGPFAASGNYVAERRQDRRRRDQRQGRRARQEDRAGHRGQQEQPDRGRRGRREADRARQGAGDDGRVGLELHARGHAEADGIQGADAGRDLVVRQDHDLGQSVRLPHLAAVGGGGGRLRRRSSTSSRSARPTSSSSTTTGAAAPPTTSARCSRRTASRSAWSRPWTRPRRT